jgi:D-proline dehydrogenase
VRVAVVGGGIVGLFAAYYSLREGLDVTVFEAKELGNGSVHAAGLIEPYRFDRINTSSMILKMIRYVKSRTTAIRQIDVPWLSQLLKELNRPPPVEAWEIMRKMAKFSLSEYARLAEERNDFDYRSDGLMELHSTRESLEKGMEEERGSPFSPKFEVVEYPGFYGAIYFPELSHLSTDQFVKRMNREIDKAEVKIKRVDRISGGRVRAEGKEEEFDKVIVAAGVWSKNLGLPVTSFKGYGYWVKVKETIKFPLVPVDQGVAIAPLTSACKITGGFDMDFTNDLSRAELFLQNARKIVKVEEVLDLKMGFRPCTPTGFPILCAVGDLVIATGNCRLGWSYAPSMGQMAVELAIGKAKNPIYLSDYCSKVNA